MSTERLAPWWAYAVPLLILNILRQLVVPPAAVGDAVSIALFLATVGIVFVVVTATHQALR
jgi:hypothetical protein